MSKQLVVAVSSDERLLFVDWDEAEMEELNSPDDDELNFESIRDYLENESDGEYCRGEAPGLYLANLDICGDEVDFEILEPLCLANGKVTAQKN